MTTSSRVAQTRLKSSFIYLANAVNDLRGNWSVLALISAPLALAAALCLLPDALNLQHRVVQTFEAAGGQSVSFIPAQVHPETPPSPDTSPPPLYPVWSHICVGHWRGGAQTYYYDVLFVKNPNPAD